MIIFSQTFPGVCPKILGKISLVKLTDMVNLPTTYHPRLKNLKSVSRLHAIYFYCPLLQRWFVGKCTERIGHRRSPTKRRLLYTISFLNNDLTSVQISQHVFFKGWVGVGVRGCGSEQYLILLNLVYDI